MGFNLRGLAFKQSMMILAAITVVFGLIFGITSHKTQNMLNKITTENGEETSRANVNYIDKLFNSGKLVGDDIAETLGKSNIQEFMENAVGESATGKWKSDDDGASRYRISFKGNAELIDECTAKVFGAGSSFQYVSDGSLNTAFSETVILTEKVSFGKFPCNSDGTSNVTFTYVNMDGSRFDATKSTVAAGSRAKKKGHQAFSSLDDPIQHNSGVSLSNLL